MDDHRADRRDGRLNDLYDRAPCGHLSTSPDGCIIEVNQTFLHWSGYEHDELVDIKSFVELLSVGGRLYHETHYWPMLQIEGSARELALDIVARDGRRLPALVNAVLDRDGRTGAPMVIRVAVFEATDRRRYEQQLVRARQDAEMAEAAARRMAETLQKTFIPPALAAIDGLEVSAVYRPAGLGAEIGGDFYDLFQVSADHWVLAIGDVQGKGVDAAVVTSLARHTIRAFAVEHHSPAAVLRDLNTVLLADGTDRFCTALVIALHRGTDGWRAVVSAGGHPLPMVSRNGSTPTEIGRPGTLLGFFPTGSFHEESIDLHSGDMVLAYTDGVSEARGDSSFFGENAIAAAMMRPADSASRLTARLLHQVLEHGGDVTRDDIAMVAVRVP
ncbi:MAG: domain S-box protein [Ilumatobacteraceae bacterium]|nr:domain S-box protein [Ilumatobacteraceae bacterium]